MLSAIAVIFEGFLGTGLETRVSTYGGLQWLVLDQ
jgi:hypothetical protein